MWQISERAVFVLLGIRLSSPGLSVTLWISKKNVDPAKLDSKIISAPNCSLALSKSQSVSLYSTSLKQSISSSCNRTMKRQSKWGKDCKLVLKQSFLTWWPWDVLDKFLSCLPKWIVAILVGDDGAFSQRHWRGECQLHKLLPNTWGTAVPILFFSTHCPFVL